MKGMAEGKSKMKKAKPTSTLDQSRSAEHLLGTNCPVPGKSSEVGPRRILRAEFAGICDTQVVDFGRFCGFFEHFAVKIIAAFFGST